MRIKILTTGCKTRNSGENIDILKQVSHNYQKNFVKYPPWTSIVRVRSTLRCSTIFAELFSVFKSILKMLWSVFFRFFLWAPISPVIFYSFSELFQTYHLHQLFLSPTCSTDFSALLQDSIIFLSFPFFLFLHCCSQEQQTSFDNNSFFLLVNARFGLMVLFGWSICISKSKRIVCVFFSIFIFCIIVAYWHRPSCQKKKCTCVNNRCIRSKISGGDLDCRRVELSANCDARRQ